MPLGQIVGRQMNVAPKALTSYSWNLLGSLIGILAFVAVSRMMLPALDLAGNLFSAGFAMLQATAKDRALVLSLLLPLALLSRSFKSRSLQRSGHRTSRSNTRDSYASNGDFAMGVLKVNHTGYQAIVDLSGPFYHVIPAC